MPGCGGLFVHEEMGPFLCKIVEQVRTVCARRKSPPPQNTHRVTAPQQVVLGFTSYNQLLRPEDPVVCLDLDRAAIVRRSTVT